MSIDIDVDIRVESAQRYFIYPVTECVEGFGFLHTAYRTNSNLFLNNVLDFLTYLIVQIDGRPTL
jgi:hypothetical protein